MSACRWISASGECKCRLTADIGRGKPPYRAVRTECVCAIRRGRRSPSLNCDADASSGRNARVDRRILKRCRTPAISQSSRADSLPNGGSLRTRRGFFTDETNVRQSAGMERECDPAVSPLERRERGKGNRCGAERKRSASMFSRSPRPIIPLRPVKGAISGGRQGDGRPYPWRGKLIFAFARRSLLSVRETFRVAPERRCRCAGTATPFYWNGRAMRKECACLAPFPAFGPPPREGRPHLREGRPPIFAKVDPPSSRRSTPFVHGEGGRGSARDVDGPRRAFGSCSIYKE